MKSHKVSGIVLAGGRSSRMGSDKALLSYNGNSLIEHAISILRNFCDNVVISAPEGRYNISGVECWPDLIPVNSAMTGVYSCLRRSETLLNVVLSCDIPLVQPGFFSDLLALAGDTEAVVPVHGDQCLEPLCAVYHKNLISLMEEKISLNNYSMRDLVLSARHILFRAEKSEYYHHGMFMNINTREDFDLLVNS